MKNRVILIILDSLGIGYLPDAKEYGDEGANTLGNIIKKCKDINIPNLINLGLANIEDVDSLESIKKTIGCYGRAKEISQGKDTTTGHWEIAGLYIDTPFNTYPKGFSKDFIKKFEDKIGRKVLGNKVASGTEIIKELGKEHIETGYPIIYTSADSVFQVAAHQDIIDIEELYDICKVARKMLIGDIQVARVIARPFIGEDGNYTRTSNRRDFSLDPIDKTILDYTKESGLDVVAIGKIEDIFNGNGITKAIHTKDNMDGVNKTIEAIKDNTNGIIFTNLVDFDSKYGHRRNPEGYKNAIEEFDKRLPEIISSLKDNDILILTADHGNDPTFKGTDHTREYIPILVYGNSIKQGVNIGTRSSFADIGATISDILNTKAPKYGESFKNIIIK